MRARDALRLDRFVVITASMIMPFETKPLLHACLALTLCASCATPAQPVSRTTNSQVSAAPDQSVLQTRVAQATSLRQAIQDAVQREDAPRNGKVKTMLVSDQLRTSMDLVERNAPTAPYQEPNVSKYEAACLALEAAYLGTELESTDPASKTGAWTSDEGRDVLGSDTVDAKLAAWQSRDPLRPFAKFAVVSASDGKGLAVRVGALDTAHVDIAGGAALSAGLLQSSVIHGKTRVVVVENTSGGYRPGPLRNRITREALEAAGYLPEAPSDFTIYANPTGGYDASKLIVSTKH